MSFKILSPISEVQTIATGTAIRERKRLRKMHGKGRWRKLEGNATVRLSDGTIRQAEVHWYQAHGIGAKEYKIKRILQEHEEQD